MRTRSSRSKQSTNPSTNIANEKSKVNSQTQFKTILMITLISVIIFICIIWPKLNTKANVKIIESPTYVNNGRTTSDSISKPSLIEDKLNMANHTWSRYIVRDNFGNFESLVTKTGQEGGEWSMCIHFAHKRHEMFDHGLANFIAFKLAPQSALDFGCGIGLYIDYYAQYYYHYRSQTSQSTPQNGLFIGMEPEPMVSAGVFGTYSIQLMMNIFESDSDILSSIPMVDVVTSLEVAEHIPYKYHETLMDFLVSKCSKYLVFSAARPGQGGIGHLDESMFTKEEWVQKFENKGMKHLPNLSQMVRDRLCRLSWFRSNVIIMAKDIINVEDVDHCDAQCEQDIRNAQTQIIDDSKKKIQQQSDNVAGSDTISDLRYLTQNIWSTYWERFTSDDLCQK